MTDSIRTIRKQQSAAQGRALSNRYRVKTFKTREAMHVFLAKGDNSIHWKECRENMKSGVYTSQIGRCGSTGKTIETLTRV